MRNTVRADFVVVVNAATETVDYIGRSVVEVPEIHNRKQKGIKWYEDKYKEGYERKIS